MLSLARGLPVQSQRTALTRRELEMNFKKTRSAAGGRAARTIITGLAISFLTGCSDQESTVDDNDDVAIDRTHRSIDVDERPMADADLNQAQRLYDVAETPAFPANDGDEQRRSGIFSSFRKGVLQLNEDGQVHSYPLAQDVSVHYPGGTTGLSDLRLGDKVTLILEPRDPSDGTPANADEEDHSDFVVQRIEKHTESVDRK